MISSKIKQLLKIGNTEQVTYGIYQFIKHKFKDKLGRRFKLSLVEQIVITLFKLKYNLPDRVLESLVNVDHVTISRAITRMVIYMSHIKIKSTNNNGNNYYVVDSTTIRIGKEKTKKDYSGYKHYYGLKYQVICNDNKEIISVSQGYESSLHDKKLFLIEYKNIVNKLTKNLSILGDKAYVGLENKQVLTSAKRNEKRYKIDPTQAKINNKLLNKKRVKIEHIFAQMKNYRIIRQANYYAKNKIDLIFKSIANILTISNNVSVA